MPKLLSPTIFLIAFLCQAWFLRFGADPLNCLISFQLNMFWQSWTIWPLKFTTCGFCLLYTYIVIQHTSLHPACIFIYVCIHKYIYIETYLIEQLWLNFYWYNWETIDKFLIFILRSLSISSATNTYLIGCLSG